MNTCPHCGMIHQATCPRIKAIEYNQDGTVKRVEFHAPQPVAGLTIPMQDFPFRSTVSNTYDSSALSNDCEQDEGA